MGGDLAFQRGMALAHAGCINQAGIHGRQASNFKFTHVLFQAGHVHGLSQITGGQIPGEHAGFNGIAHAVFVTYAGKSDDRRAVVEHVAETVRGQIQHTFRAFGTDPANDTGPHNRADRVVAQSMALCGLVKMKVFLHGSLCY